MPKLANLKTGGGRPENERRSVIPILQETRKLEQSAQVELWQLDMRKIGGEILYFCNQPNELGGNVRFGGIEYQAYPIKSEGFELSSEGASARPTLTVANIGGMVTAAAEQFNQLVGASVLRIITFAEFLDPENFENGNPKADPTQYVESVFLVEQLSTLNAELATLTLAVPAEGDGSVFPSRVMMANLCSFIYRDADSGCPYPKDARPVADEHDIRTNDPAKDSCSRTLLGCKARFGETAALPFGGFPSANKLS